MIIKIFTHTKIKPSALITDIFATYDFLLKDYKFLNLYNSV